MISDTRVKFIVLWALELKRFLPNFTYTHMSFNLDCFWPKWGKMGIFVKKALGTFCSRLQTLTAKLEKKVMNACSENLSWTNRRGLNSKFLQIIQRTN